MDTVRYIGCDKSGTPRVYGEARQADVAYSECRKAVFEYVRRRPDTGPADTWLIEIES